MRLKRRLRACASAWLLAMAVLMVAPAPAQVTQLPTWIQQSPASSPSARVSAGMAYDAATRQPVLFGGQYSNQFLSDTWTWNGSAWTLLAPPASPLGRADAAMAYDTATGQLLLFGGWTAGDNNTEVTLSDTWTWDGSTWTQLSPSASPSARAGASMAYDAATGELVLFGGLSNGTYLNDTWTWDGSTWTQQSPPTSPTTRENAGMAYDVATAQLVLSGGSRGGVLADTWTWNGGTWTQVSLGANPSNRAAAAMTYDSEAGQAMLFGGYSNTIPFGDTWAWNGSAWAQLSPTASPAARGYAAIADDTATGQVVLFGGNGVSGYLTDTWTLQWGPVNLGTANVCPPGTTSPSPCSQSTTITFSVAAGTTVGSVNILTGGATRDSQGNLLDFQSTPNDTSTTLCSAQTYASQTTCTVDVTFAPRYAGQRMGAVVIADGSGNPLATVNVSGNGVAPQAVFSPGTVSTLSTGISSPIGIAVDGAGNVFVGDTQNNAVWELLAGGGSRKIASNVPGIGYMAVDGAGNLFAVVAPLGSTASVKEFVAAGGYTTVKTLVSDFKQPAGIALDSSDDVFVADSGNNEVKEIVAANGYMTVLSLGAGFNDPIGVALDSAGNVFVSDYGNSAIKEIVAASGYTMVNTLAQTYGTNGLAVDAAGNVYFSNYDSAVVYELLAAGGYTTTTTLAQGVGGVGIALDAKGNVYFTQYSPSAVMKLDVSDAPSLTFASTAVGQTSADSPQIVTVQNIGNANLNIRGVSFASDFPEDAGGTSDCTSSTSLAAGGSCTLTIDFSPLPASATGLSTPLSETVSITDNNLNGTSVQQPASVNGTATFTAPALTTPSPGSALAGSSQTFTWSAGSATLFQLQVGTSYAGSSNVYKSGWISATSADVPNIPANDAPLYVRLFYRLNGVWKDIDYTYTESGSPYPSMTSPVPNSVLSGTSQTFTWHPGAATTFQLFIGTQYPGASDVYKSTWVSTSSVNVPSIPANGANFYVRFYYKLNGVWSYIDYVYLESGSPRAPSMISPAPGSTLSGSSQTFTWDPGTAATVFEVRVGTTRGGSNIYNSGTTKGTSVTVAIGTHGKLWVRLWYYTGGTWSYVDYSYYD